MPGLIFAVADRPSRRTRERRRRSDLAFLARDREAGADELDRMLWDGRNLPPWRQEAIRRAIARALARQGDR